MADLEVRHSLAPPRSDPSSPGADGFATEPPRRGDPPCHQSRPPGAIDTRLAEHAGQNRGARSRFPCTWADTTTAARPAYADCPRRACRVQAGIDPRPHRRRPRPRQGARAELWAAIQAHEASAAGGDNAARQGRGNPRPDRPQLQRQRRDGFKAHRVNTQQADEALIAAIDSVRDVARQCFEHYNIQQLLGAWLPNQSTNIEYLALPVRAAVERHPIFKRADNKPRVEWRRRRGVGCRTPSMNLGRSLATSAKIIQRCFSLVKVLQRAQSKRR